MKTRFEFSNLLGTVYRSGNFEFTKSGSCLYTPVGNQVRHFDLKNDSSFTFGVNANKNIVHMLLSPTSHLLVAIDEDGQAALCSTLTRCVISRFHFKAAVTAAAFSPDGRFLLVAKNNMLWLYHAPTPERQLNQFVLKRAFTGPTDDITCIDWSSDSRVFVVGGLDGDTRVYSVEKCANLLIYSLGGHSHGVAGVHFATNEDLDVISVGANGKLRFWSCDTNLAGLLPWSALGKIKDEEKKEDGSDAESDGSFDVDLDAEDDREEERRLKQKAIRTEKRLQRLAEVAAIKVRYRSKNRFEFRNADTDERVGAHVTCTAYHRTNQMLVTGFEDGCFMIHNMPAFLPVQQLSISQSPVSCVRINKSSEWIALGVKERGQLAVWEWQAETFHIRQQSHFNAMNCLSFSPSGQHVATGGLDGKVKVWDAHNGLCFVTFSEHKAGVTGVRFAMHRGLVLFSASLDGTVRAFDLGRYRNFRTFAAPEPCQFSCIAVDGSGDLVAAGGLDTFAVHVWSVRTGQLLDLLTGHEGPVSGLEFAPNSAVLASASWDKSVRLWDVLDSRNSREDFRFHSDAICLAFRPDGEEIAVALLNGQILLLDPHTGRQKGSIEAKAYLGYFKRDGEALSSKKASAGRTFQAICYSANGECLLAGGQSKNVCLFSATDQMLLRTFVITCNRSLEGVQEIHDRRKMTSWGSMALIDMGDGEKGKPMPLPGVKEGDFSGRSFKPEVRVSSLQFAPTGMAWAATTTEGLLVFSLDASSTFSAELLEENVTPNETRRLLKTGNMAQALEMALRLRQKELMLEVVESIPADQISFLARRLSPALLLPLLSFLAGQLKASRHLHFYLLWSHRLLRSLDLRRLRSPDLAWRAAIRLLLGAVRKKMEELEPLCAKNAAVLRCLTQMPLDDREEEEEEDEGEEAKQEKEVRRSPSKKRRKMT